VDEGESVHVSLEARTETGWAPLPEATLKGERVSATANTEGTATLSLLPGAYHLFAEKSGYVRSAVVLVTVGERNETSIPLSVTITPPPQGNGNGGSLPTPEISFVITKESGGASPHLSFGELKAGEEREETIKLENRGSVSLYSESEVTGDALFSDFLTVRKKHWREFNDTVLPGEARQLPLALRVPETYEGGGEKKGTLTFWAVYAP
jgi:hypothetical protein